MPDDIEVGDLVKWVWADEAGVPSVSGPRVSGPRHKDHTERFGIIVLIGKRRPSDQVPYGPDDALWALWADTEDEAIRLFRESEKNQSHLIKDDWPGMSFTTKSSTLTKIILLRKRVNEDKKCDRFERVIESLK